MERTPTEISEKFHVKIFNVSSEMFEVKVFIVVQLIVSINISLTSALLENEDPSWEEESNRRDVEEELEAGDRTGGDVGDEDGTDDDKEAHYSTQPHQGHVRSAQVNSIVRQTEDQKDDQDEDLKILGGTNAGSDITML